MSVKYVPFTISYSPMLAKELGGSIHAAIIFERLRFWATTKDFGEFYKSQQEIADECGFNLKTVERALPLLVKHGFISKRIKKDPTGVPKNHITVQLNLFIGKTPTTPPKVTSTTPSTVQTSITEKTYTISEQARNFSIQDEMQRKPREVVAPTSKKYSDLCVWLSQLTGAPIPNRGKQYKHLSVARAAEIGPERLKRRAEELWAISFYRDHGMDWGTVVSSFDKKA